MKAIIDCPIPFSLGHGGAQTQIERTKAGLEQAGVEVEFARWWDGSQTVDLIHFFGVPDNDYLALARLKNVPVILTNLFTAACNRSNLVLELQRCLTQTVLWTSVTRNWLARPKWKAIKSADHQIVGLEAEKRVLRRVYGVPEASISCVPLGLPDAFLQAAPGRRDEPHLICTGTITGRKRTVELARLARAAQVPVLFVGKPYSEAEAYWREFKGLVDGRIVKHHSHVGTEQEMIALLQRSRGSVIMSKYENWCLSAHEAAACGLPLLLPDQKWSRECFGNGAHYFTGQITRDVRVLREFYERCPALPPPKVRLYSWVEVGRLIKAVYERVLSTSR
jgi:glycosyltransferase involved in cell wall biosynthesis